MFRARARFWPLVGPSSFLPPSLLSLGRGRQVTGPLSIDLPIGGLAASAPFLSLRRDESPELARRAWIGAPAKPCDGGLHLFSTQAFVDRGVEPVDDRGGRARGRHDAEEGQDFIIGHSRFRDGRKVGCERRARAARHPKRAQLALADERQ